MAIDTLQTLIESLNKSEKRYFRRFAASFKEHSKLLELFNTLEKGGQTELTHAQKDQPAMRSLLRGLILKAMRLYHESSNPISLLRSSLGEIDFLISKQLYHEAEKEIRKARKLASDLHDHQTALDLLLKENEMRGVFKDETELCQEFKSRRQQAKNHVSQLADFAQLKLLNSEWNLYLHQFGRSGVGAGSNYFNQNISPHIKSHEHEQTPDPLNEVVSTITLCEFNTMFGDISVTEHMIDRVSQLYEKHPELGRYYYNKYFALLYNHSCGLFIKGEIESSLIWCEKVALTFERNRPALEKMNDAHSMSRFRFGILSGRIRALNRLNRFDETLKHIAEYEHLFNSGLSPSFTSTRILLNLRMASAYYHTGQTAEAMALIQQGLLLKEVRSMATLEAVYLLAEALCFLDLGHFDLGETKLSNLYKNLMRYDDRMSFRPAQVEFVRKAWKFKTGPYAHEELNQLVGQLNDQGTDGLILDFFDPVQWLLRCSSTSSRHVISKAGPD